MSIALAGCGDDDVPAGGDAGEVLDASAADGAVGADAGGAADAALADAAAVGDAGSPGDGGAPVDAGSPGDGGVAADAGPPLVCAAGSAIADRIAGVCDGRGRMACSMWAMMTSGGGATAQCVPPDGRCGRGDACDASGCTCGGAPECADDQMCVADAAGGGFHCVCITPA